MVDRDGVSIAGGCGCLQQTEELEITWAITQEGAYTFADGITVDLWEPEQFFDRYEYRLADGTVLLTHDDIVPPSNVHAGGMVGFDGLSGSAQTAVLTYYEELGTLYDLEAELENAYVDYLLSPEDGAEFQYHILISLVRTLPGAAFALTLFSSILEWGRDRPWPPSPTGCTAGRVDWRILSPVSSLWRFDGTYCLIWRRGVRRL